MAKKKSTVSKETAAELSNNILKKNIVQDIYTNAVSSGVSKYKRKKRGKKK